MLYYQTKLKNIAKNNMKIKHHPIVAAVAIMIMLTAAFIFAGFIFFGSKNPEGLFCSGAVFAGTLVIGFGYLKTARSFSGGN